MRTVWFFTKVVLAIAWGIPWAGLAVPCFMSIILLPIGAGLMTIASWPLYKLIQNRLALPESPTDGKKPWE
jgi:hypothetical protein